MSAYAGAFVLRGRAIDRALAPAGYIKGDTAYYFLRDHQGSVRQVVSGADGSVVQENQYYPYGALHGESSALALASANGASASPYKYGGKEHISFANAHLLDFTARTYDPAILSFHQPDPLQEKHYGIDSRVFCLGNPICFTDPTGCDTVNICYDNGKWNISDPILAEGNDVFIVNDGENTTTYTFSEGEYGNRVDALTLENDGEGSYALGVYHVSGKSEGATGFYVTPGGEPSNAMNSGRRIEDGVYPMTTPFEGRLWETPGVGGTPINRGVRFHYAEKTDALTYTQGCFVLATDYSVSNGRIKYDVRNSQDASINFNNALGGRKKEFCKKNRIGATFDKPITHILILKTK